MASPFRLFRKYQKTLLVVAGVVLMFVFVIGDALMGYLGGGPAGGAARQGARAPGAVAVRWNGGSLTNSQLDELVMRRQLVNAFLRAVEGGGEQAAIDAGVEPRGLKVERLLGAETPQQGVEADVVRTKLFADLARKAGMKVSDDAIVRYLDELGRQHVSREDMRGVIERMQVGGGRASIDYMFNALREEMLARNYLAGYQFALATVTPEERWRDWLRLNDRVVIEALPIPSEKFLLDVAEPSDQELVEFFEKYKNFEPLPDLRFKPELPSSVPGFAIPHKIDVQYLLANYDQFLTKVEAEITDAEIEKFYEENKDTLFVKLDTGLMDEAPMDDATTDDGASETDENDTSSSETDPSNEATETETNEAASESTPDATQPADANEAGEAEAPAQSAEGEAQPPAGAEGGEATPAEGDQSSHKGQSERSPFRLTAFLQESAATDEARLETDSSDATEPPAEGAAEIAAPTTDAAPTTPAASTESAATETPAADTSADAAASESATGTAQPADAKPKEYQPLDEVRDEIRRQLAGQRVTEQLIELMSKLENQLNSEFTKYFAASLRAEAEDKELAPPPALADLEPIAKEHGLSFGKTGLMSALQLRDDTPIGKLVDMERSNERMEVPLISTLFSEESELYQPFSGYDVDANRFIVQKIAETPRRVPKLDEVRDEVVRAWKKQKAAELAQKNAEELAKKIQESDSTLGEYFANDQSASVIRTDPFSWLTGGEVSRFTGQQQPFRLSEPDGVVAAGPEFLREVFTLGDSEVGAVQNHDHSIAYIVRVDSHQMPVEELRAAYLAEANNWPGLSTMIAGHMQDATRSLLADVELDADIKWERPADQMPQDESADEPQDE